MVRKNNLIGPGPGRPQGAKNKVTKAVQDCLVEAFHSPEIGGVKGLIEWGKHMPNREAFYKLIARLIPRPTTTVNVDVGTTERPFDLAKRLTEARDRLNRIRNEGDDSHVKRQKSGNVTHTVISSHNKKDESSLGLRKHDGDI